MNENAINEKVSTKSHILPLSEYFYVNKLIIQKKHVKTLVTCLTYYWVKNLSGQQLPCSVKIERFIRIPTTFYFHFSSAMTAYYNQSSYTFSFPEIVFTFQFLGRASFCKFKPNEKKHNNHQKRWQIPWPHRRCWNSHTNIYVCMGYSEIL